MRTLSNLFLHLGLYPGGISNFNASWLLKGSVGTVLCEYRKALDCTALGRNWTILGGMPVP